ncbi:MAG: Ktr system potassium uptake protein A [Anaerolineae bacterium]|nr:Ktr system potassium uptake protein A [Anaerolineae bacterium]MDL1895241.1 TrkA family potassium uptake protein [Anaerolineae bacterium CFX7]
MANKSKSSEKKQTGKEFAVIGLGRFGASVARRLETLGHVVLGVDREMTLVQAISDDITSAIALDVTNEDALQDVEIGSFHTVIVGLADDFEATALVTTFLKEMGVARVICLASSGRHRNILLRIGADQVILSDEDSGIHLAEQLSTPNMQERVQLDAGHSLVEMRVPPSLTSQPLTSLTRYNVAVLLIQRGEQLIPCPNPETRLEQGDALFLAGPRDKLLEIASLP